MIDTKLDLAGATDIWSRIESLRQNTMDLLAPAMRAALIATLKAAQGQTATAQLADGTIVHVALDPIIHETLRSDELQAIYYAQGASKAKTARKSWHFYGLAADLISDRYGWFTDATACHAWPRESDRATIASAWFRGMADIAKSYGLAWGGDWEHYPDLPHVQWGHCAPTPEKAPAIYDAAGGGLRGRQAVWAAVHADVVPPSLAEHAA